MPPVDPDPSKLHTRFVQVNVNDATGGLSTGGATKSEYRSRFGEPEPTALNRFGVALLTTAEWTAPGVAVFLIAPNKSPKPGGGGGGPAIPRIVFLIRGPWFPPGGYAAPGGERPR